jgi:thiamine biosynthesis protein ThiS
VDAWTVTVNGAARPVPEGCTVAELLRLMEVDPVRVAVERNLEVVPRRTWSQAVLADGDRLEVVTFVGGG